MPELDIIPMQYCKSGHEFQSWKVKSSNGTKMYEVCYRPYKPDVPFTCTCIGFRVRKDCKHIKEKWHEVCFWSELHFKQQTDEQAEQMICPECGGPTIWIRTGV